MGISKDKYVEAQAARAEDEFKFNVLQSIQNLKSAIEELSKSLSSSIAEAGSLKSEIKSQFNDLEVFVHNKTNTSLNEIGDLKEEVNVWKRFISSITQDIDSRVTAITFCESLGEVNRQMQASKRDLEERCSQINGLIERKSAEVDSKLLCLKNELINMPSEIPSIKKAFDQKFDLVELNGQNAVLRSTNNERQILLLERKIENLYQLIKKIDITNQESS